MAKFRSLTHEELESMEKEFIDFLVLNGITGEDWEKLKQENPENAEGICDAFSDVVFIKILKNCRYIESHSPKHLVAIFCDENTMHLQGLEAPMESTLDFTNPEDFEILKTAPPAGIKRIKSTKEYEGEREEEIWKMLNNGFFISDQKLYMTLFSL
ncbi:MAG: DUF6495 family protein [Saprospiraceae bacterium]|nr:DUF6495 family protein [Saprospiraceae bacterium]